MDEKRLKIAKRNFNNYLKKGLIKKENFQDIVYQTYLKNAAESLSVANEIYKNKLSSLWVVVSSYYAMFYIASAYVYKKGYKTRHKIVHQIINEALIVFSTNDLEKHFFKEYEEEREKALAASENLLKDYESEKNKKSKISI